MKPPRMIVARSTRICHRGTLYGLVGFASTASPTMLVLLVLLVAAAALVLLLVLLALALALIPSLFDVLGGQGEITASLNTPPAISCLRCLGTTIVASPCGLTDASSDDAFE